MGFVSVIVCGMSADVDVHVRQAGDAPPGGSLLRHMVKVEFGPLTELCGTTLRRRGVESNRGVPSSSGGVTVTCKGPLMDRGNSAASDACSLLSKGKYQKVQRAK